MVRQDVTAQQVEALVSQFKGVVEAHKGKIAKVETWGLRSLAYRIKKNRKAHFTLMNIDAPPAAVAEMERQMAINEDIIRTLTIKVDAHEDGPSAMLRKREDADGERGDRDGRRGGFGRGDRPDRGDRGDRGDRPDRPPRRPREDHAPHSAAPHAAAPHAAAPQAAAAHAASQETH